MSSVLALTGMVIRICSDVNTICPVTININSQVCDNFKPGNSWVTGQGITEIYAVSLWVHNDIFYCYNTWSYLLVSMNREDVYCLPK